MVAISQGPADARLLPRGDEAGRRSGFTAKDFTGARRQPALVVQGCLREMKPHDRLRRAAGHHQLLFPARASHRRRWWPTAASSALPPSASPTETASPGGARLWRVGRRNEPSSSGRHASRDDRWFRGLAYPTIGGLWPACRCYARQCQIEKGQKGECHMDFRGCLVCQRRARCSSPCRRRRSLLLQPTARSTCPRRAGARFLAASTPSRRRAPPPRMLDELGQRTRRALVAVTRCSITHPQRRPLADVPHLHPREVHGCRSGLPARGQCRAHSSACGKWTAVRTLSRGNRCARSRSPKPAAFSLGDLKYEYPDEPVPPARRPRSISRIDMERRQYRYPRGQISGRSSTEVRRGSAMSLRSSPGSTTRATLLTVHGRGRLRAQPEHPCQGRGSAANSAVCYCLGITEVTRTRASFSLPLHLGEPQERPTSTSISSTSGARR